MPPRYVRRRREPSRWQGERAAPGGGGSSGGGLGVLNVRGVLRRMGCGLPFHGPERGGTRRLLWCDGRLLQLCGIDRHNLRGGRIRPLQRIPGRAVLRRVPGTGRDLSRKWCGEKHTQHAQSKKTNRPLHTSSPLCDSRMQDRKRSLLSKEGWRRPQLHLPETVKEKKPMWWISW